MNRAEQFWAQTLDHIMDAGRHSDGPEAFIVEGLRLLRQAEVNGSRVRSWYRSGVVTITVESHDVDGWRVPYPRVTWFGRGRSLLQAIERLGQHDAH